MAITPYHCLSKIAPRYDAFLVDLWGVIHDGLETYDGVSEALLALKQAGKHIIFLSNAPRRSTKAIEKLEELGIGTELYDQVITSGEITHHYIKSGEHGFSKNYMMIGPARDNGLLDGTDYQRVEHASDAGFLVVTGFDHDGSVLDDVVPLLEQALEHELPMICANPDLVVVRKNGTRALCAGIMAEHYQTLGGIVQQFGKPYPEVYHAALSHLDHSYLSRIAAIGDNLETDIRGANNKGIDSYLIPGGILGEHFGIEHGELPNEEDLERLCKNYNATPTGVLPAFIWRD